MKKQPVPTGREPSLEDTLLAFRRKLSDILRKEAEEMKCPLSQIDTLSYIAEKGSPSMKEIASHLKITPPSTTAIVETMIKKSLVTRVTNSTDRRTVRIALTPKAWKFFKELHERKFMVFTDMTAKLRDTEKKQLIKILTILIRE